MSQLNINKKETIQEIATKLVDDQTKNNVFLCEGSKETTIFILGSKGVGKTTILNRFLDRSEAARPTLALEYSFGRRTALGQIVQKEICNVWELGSLLNSNQLIEIPIRSHGIKNFSSVIVLDLSQPDRLWTDLESALNGLKEATITHQQYDENEVNLKSRERIGLKHPDLKTLELFPFSMVIVGGKYDLFENLEPEIKKHVCRCLRSIAHAIGSSLYFYSAKNANLTKTMRDILNSFGFGSPLNPIRKTITNYNEPISIPYGGDSWEKIGVVPTNSERIGITYSTQIPQVNNENEINSIIIEKNDPAKDSGFREAVIDELRAQKNEELLRLIRDTEMRIKFGQVLVESSN